MSFATTAIIRCASGLSIFFLALEKDNVQDMMAKGRRYQLRTTQESAVVKQGYVMMTFCKIQILHLLGASLVQNR